MKSYEQIKQEIVEEAKNGSSIAFHCTHSWDSSKEEGVWCVDCNQWVLLVDKGEK